MLVTYTLIGNSSSPSFTGLDGQGPCRVKSKIGSAHSLPITQIVYHKSGTLFASGSRDGTVKVWDTKGGYMTHQWGGIAGGISMIGWSPIEKNFSRDDKKGR